VVIRADETISSIKERVQKKLKVPDEDFSKVMPSTFDVSMF
jgi:ubiquitin carboxyl-terminal hydrolase 7